MSEETTATGFGILLDAHTLRFERDLTGPIERVWAYLTQSDLKATWIGPGEIPREVGGEHSVRWDGEDGQPGGELRLRTRIYDPPHVLEYDWIEVNAPSGAIRDSIVRFELAARGDRVHLTLTHRALPTDSYAMVAAGWHAHLDTLAAQLAGEDGPDAEARYAVIALRYGTLGTFPAAGTVRFERILAAPVERVWSLLTEPDLLAGWLGRGTIPSRAGERFTLTLRANDDAVSGEVRECDAPRTLAYTWFSHRESERAEHSVVRFELTPHDDGTSLVLTHTGVLPEFYGRVAAGWHTLLDGLAAAATGAAPPAFLDVFPRVIDAYEAAATS